jgi:heat shock protein HtpX
VEAVGRNGLRAAAPAVILVTVALLAGVFIGGSAGLAGACFLLAVAWWLAYFFAQRAVPFALGARPLTEVERPELYGLVRELSTAARVPVPRLFVCPWLQPNSFVVGCTSRTASLCVTDGLLAVLSRGELRAVIGHELAHVRRYDMVLSTFPALAAGLVLRLGTVPGLMPLVCPVAAAGVRLTVRPGREYGADADGALMTGDALALASALRKIEMSARQSPVPFSGRLAATSHLLIVDPFRGVGLERLFDTHPPVGERLRRLEALAGYPRLNPRHPARRPGGRNGAQHGAGGGHGRAAGAGGGHGRAAGAGERGHIRHVRYIA